MFASPAHAQAAGAAAAGGPPAWVQFVPFVAVLAIFYFLMVRPQMRQAKQHRDLVSNVKKGDTVVTAGGLIGKATKVEDREVEVEIAAGVRVRVVKSTLSDVQALGAAKAAND